MPIYAQSSTLRDLIIPLVDVDYGTLQQDDILQYNSTTGKFENQTLTSGGQAIITTASNVGIGDGFFKQKTSQDLEFKTITAGAGIVITAGADEIEVASNLALTTASNLGAGEQIFSAKVGDDFQFRTLNEGTGNINFIVSTNGNEIEFVNTAEINTASNTGVGEGVFKQKTIYNLEFKGIVAGDNVTVTSDADSITISSQNEGPTAYSYQFTVNFDGSGNVDSVADLPTGWTVNIIGNVITVSHNTSKMLKSVSYWGRDATNGWQYRLPTAGYQATIAPGNETTEFSIDIAATVAGADASSYAKVNVIF